VEGETVEVTRVVEVEVPGESAGSITFWSTETQPARAERTQAIIDRFTAETGIAVELVLVDENSMGSIMAANQAAGTLPDVVFHPLQRVFGWYNEGVLDAQAAAEVVNELGADTFSQGALEMVTIDSDPAAVPTDGWGQFIVYRTDVFGDLGLEAPTTFATIRAAAEACDAEGFIGIMAGTDPGQGYTQETFEHFALANGVEFADAAGNVTMNTPEFIETLTYYTDLMAEVGPKDTATYWDQARALYFAGEVCMTLWSPFIMDEMAGLRDSVLPSCDECADDPAFIAKNSAFVGNFAGPNGAPAQWGQVSYTGITTGADTEAAKEFVKFWLSDGYLDWLGVAAEGKFPMRSGTADNPTEYIDGWGQLEVGVDRRAPLSDFYSAEVLADVVAGANNLNRPMIPQGQGLLLSAISAERVIPQAIADVIDGFLTPEEAAELLQEQVEDIQAALDG
jgi:multiple sugar transport system substrate-binding protein